MSAGKTYASKVKRLATAKSQKSPALYLCIVGLWALLMVPLLDDMLPLARRACSQQAVIGVMFVMTTVFISYFWLNGVKDVVYTLYYHLWLKKRQMLPPLRNTTATPLVVLVYCTCNDFNGDSLLASMRQNYFNYKVVILDDSSKPEFIAEINAFAARYRVEVVRRENRAGFKAGNLNNYLRAAEFDYFVILDSDEVIPPDFIPRSLDYFAVNSVTGIVQANHRATRNRTGFMRMFARGVDSHWPTYQVVKDCHGFLSLLGHGAMVSRECYETVSGFPHVVAEDICFSIAAREMGYLTVFASDILCDEEYPLDYLAFRKRHGKWTEGNMEFIRRNTGTILCSPMCWFEKLDIVLFTYALPLTALFSVYVIINAMVFPAMGYSFRYPLWMLVPTIVFLIAPMLNDIITYWRKMTKLKLLSYLLHSTALYGSMYFISLKASLKSAFGTSVFHVTPKDSAHVGFRQALSYCKGELMFGLALALIVTVASGTVFPVILLVPPAIFAIYLVVMHNGS